MREESWRGSNMDRAERDDADAHYHVYMAHSDLPSSYATSVFWSTVRRRVRRRADHIAWALDKATPASATPATMNGGREERLIESAYQRATAPAMNIIGMMNVTANTVRRDTLLTNAFMT